MLASMNWPATFYRFDGYPVSDSCWSLSAGPDGRIYAAACCESSPGQSVKVVRYNEKDDKLDWLFDAAKVAEDPPDSGRATQCKIHYSFAASARDGILYCATHLSGPPKGEKFYSPWRSWHDPRRCFKGSALIAYDTRESRVLWHDTLIPKEGCRCLALDEERGRLYAISYPRDHFIVYSLKDRTRRDLGRLGSVNSQAIFVDRRHRVWTSNDDGRLVRYDPDRDALEESPYILPHPDWQTGWHSVFYDVASWDDAVFYAVTWNTAPRLYRLWTEEGAWGRVEDLGPATQDRDASVPFSMFLDHAGGLVFDREGRLYWVRSRWRNDREQEADGGRQFGAEGVLMRLDPATLKREEIMVLRRPDGIAQYCSRAARDRHGDLFFANVGRIPVGLFRVRMPNRSDADDATKPLRSWG